MYLLIHDEIKGPAIKCSFFTTPITLPQEFISKLYMSHAGFGSSSCMELKFEHYRSVSLFTGHVARQSKKEGILGIIFEENEKFSNLDLFLQRNLKRAIDNPNTQTMEDIFSHSFLPYLALNKIFNEVRVQNISELLVITGDKEYKSCLLTIGESMVSPQEMADIYMKITEKRVPPQYQFEELKSAGDKRVFLILKSPHPNRDTGKILSKLKPYLDAFFDYALEILILFLLPSEVKLAPLNLGSSKKYPNKGKSVLQILQKSKYGEEFNKLLSSLINGDINLTSTSTI